MYKYVFVIYTFVLAGYFFAHAEVFYALAVLLLNSKMLWDYSTLRSKAKQLEYERFYMT